MISVLWHRQNSCTAQHRTLNASGMAALYSGRWPAHHNSTANFTFMLLLPVATLPVVYFLIELKICSHFDSLSLGSKQLSTTDTNTTLQEYLSERTDLSIGNTLDLRLGGYRFELLPGHTVFAGTLSPFDQNRIHSNPFQFVYNKIICI
jgi:hypothetical protein